jgi:hypothetical protein
MDEELERKVEELKRENPNMTKQLERNMERLKREIEHVNRNHVGMGEERARREGTRLQMKAVELQIEYDLQLDAAEFKLDRETFALLRTFQEECLIKRYDGDLDSYIEHLKQFRYQIKGMGEIFQLLGLARKEKWSEYGWEPKQKLRDIICERISSGRKFAIETAEGVHELNVAIIRAYLEVADVATFIVDVMSALGVNKARDNGWRPNRALRQLLIAVSVKGNFTNASSKGFLAPQLRLVTDVELKA